MEKNMILTLKSEYLQRELIQEVKVRMQKMRVAQVLAQKEGIKRGDNLAKK